MSENKIKPVADADERAGWLDIARQQVGSLHCGVVEIAGTIRE